MTPRQQAKATGAKTYHGRPCRRCSGTKKRTVNGQCVSCLATDKKAKRSAARASNPDWGKKKPTPDMIARAAAQADGTITYHGKPCRRCGGTERYVVEGKCVACRIDNARAWEEANPEKSKQLQLSAGRAYYARNAEERREYARDRRASDPELRAKEAAAARLWGKENKERKQANRKRWDDANRDKVRAIAQRSYRKNYRKHHARYIAQAAAYSARLQRVSPHWLKASGQQRAIDAFYVDTPEGMEVDHDNPIAGCDSCGVVGLHILANLQYLPKQVNRQKNNRCMACFIASLSQPSQSVR